MPSTELTEEEHAKNNLPDVLARWQERDNNELKRARTEQSFCVPKADIAAQGYDLSLNRYKEVVHGGSGTQAPERDTQKPRKTGIRDSNRDERVRGDVGMTMDQVSLGEICKEIYRYPTYYGIEYLDIGVPEVRGELITADGNIDLDRQKWRFISKTTASKFPRTNLEEGDLVMSVRGTIGKVGIVPRELCGANITANLIRMSPNKQRVYERYLLLYMRLEFLNSLR